LTAHLSRYMGRMVTVTNPDTGTSQTGRMVALTTDPGIVIEQDDGLELCLPQSFTVTDASEDENHEALAASIPEQWVRAAEGWYSMHGAGLVRNLIAGAAPLIAADALERLAAEFDEFAEPEFRDAARMARERAQATCTAPDSGGAVPADTGSGLSAFSGAAPGAGMRPATHRPVLDEDAEDLYGGGVPF
jgi:hypothetical protein